MTFYALEGSDFAHLAVRGPFPRRYISFIMIDLPARYCAKSALSYAAMI